MNYFENISIFSSISPEDQQNLSDFCQLLELKSWDTLFQEWDEAQALYIISSGSLVVEKNTFQGMKQLAQLQAWDIVGEMALLWQEKKRNATLRATQDSKLIVVIQFWLSQVLEKYPLLYEKFRAIVEERWEKNKNI